MSVSIKLARSITRDVRAQAIGVAIGETNTEAGIGYLEGTSRRTSIEHDAHFHNAVKLPTRDDIWLVDCWASYHAAKNRRKR